MNQTSPAGAQVDLRSDTVTQPTPAMWEAMNRAVLGDDGLDGDPTVRALEEEAAGLLGKKAAVFMPSATMANLVAVMVQSQRQEQLVAEASSHIFTTERGGAAVSGVFYAAVAGQRGAMDIGQLEDALDHQRGRLRTALVCVETSHNNAGGAVLPLEHLATVREMAAARGIGVHLDGARLFNAAVALGRTPGELAAFAGTVTVCLSKGLSAPVGAVLAGPGSVMQEARAMRKVLGGTQRQAGIMAAAGLEGLRTMGARLGEDHRRAALLSEAINALGNGLAADVPQTNIVMVGLRATAMQSGDWVARMREAGVLVRAWGPHRLRCVTHRHVDDAAIARAVAAFAACRD